MFTSFPLLPLPHPLHTLSSSLSSPLPSSLPPPPFTPTSPSYIYFNQWSKSTYINSLRRSKEVLSQEDKIELVVFWQCCWSSDWIVSSVVVHKCHRNCVEYNNHVKQMDSFVNSSQRYLTPTRGLFPMYSQPEISRAQLAADQKLLKLTGGFLVLIKGRQELRNDSMQGLLALTII